jgi:hypothetical protein
MSKQMIEIDVPEGYEIYAQVQSTQYYTRVGSSSDVTIHFKKKETEFIEFKNYLAKDIDGSHYVSSIHNGDSGCGFGQDDPDFIKWLDFEWRKVVINDND